MKNRQTHFISAFASLVVIGVTCTGCGNNLPNLSLNLPQYSQQLTKETAKTSNDNDGFLGLSPQSWINLILFLMNATGIAYGFFGLKKAKRVGLLNNRLSQKHEENIKHIGLDLKKLTKDLELINGEIAECLRKQKATDIEVKQLIQKYTYILVRVDNQASSQMRSPASTSGQVSLDQQTDPLSSNSDQNRVQGSSFNLYGQSKFSGNTSYFGSTPIKTASQQQEELTASVNRNDRQAIRNATRTQLNFTSASENAFATGRLTQTELEEVSGGGSYLLMQIEDQVFLYPTEQTLKGFGQLQPAKGVFNYVKQPIASPQVLTPALVELVGTNWHVQQQGTIAVPS